MEITPADVSMSEIRDFVQRTFRPVAEQKSLSFNVDVDARCANPDRHRRTAASAGAQEPAVELVQVHRARRRHAVDSPRRDGAPLRQSHARSRRGRRDRVRGEGHRHRHSEGQTKADLRGVPAGRRHDEPQVRRHGAGSVDQPRDRAPPRRRDSRREHAGPGSTFTLYRAGRSCGTREA